jgi:hypothetical protein
VANQAGNAAYAAAPSVAENFTVSGSITVIQGGGDGDIPLPIWAYVMLSLGLMWVARLRTPSGTPTSKP